MNYCYCDTKIGQLLLAGDSDLEHLFFPISEKPENYEKKWDYNKEPFQHALKQLADYFSGSLHVFNVTLKITGTEFQKTVWTELTKIPYGETITYGELAKRIGNPKASRAVGMANNKNPVPVIIPCHRVIGKDGSLTGFGGGLGVKQTLLDLERDHV